MTSPWHIDPRQVDAITEYLRNVFPGWIVQHVSRPDVPIQEFRVQRRARTMWLHVHRAALESLPVPLAFINFLTSERIAEAMDLGKTDNVTGVRGLEDIERPPREEIRRTSQRQCPHCDSTKVTFGDTVSPDEHAAECGACGRRFMLHGRRSEKP